MKRVVFAFLFAALAFCASHAQASATTCAVPNTLSNGAVVDANGLNANFNALKNCGNSVDNSQIGPSGIYASQINPTSSATATFGGAYPYVFPLGVVLNSPLPVGSGGLGPQSAIAAYPNGTQFVFFGDSITYGYGINGQVVYGCTGSAGHCYADLVTAKYGGTEINLGLPGSMLQTTSDAGGIASGFSRYTTTMLPYCGANTNVIVDFYGSNDYHTSDTSASPAAYYTDQLTIVNACLSAGTLPQNFTIVAPTFMDDATALYGQSDVFGVMDRYKLAAAQVAEVTGVRFTDVSDALANGAGAGQLQPQGQGLLTDNIHPGNAGHAIIATQIENAQWIKAFAYDAAMNATSAREKNGWRTTGPITCGTNYAGRTPSGNCEFRITNTPAEFIFDYPVPTYSAAPNSLMDMNTADGSLTLRPQEASTAAAQNSGPLQFCGSTTGINGCNKAAWQADPAGDMVGQVPSGDQFELTINGVNVFDVTPTLTSSLSTVSAPTFKLSGGSGPTWAQTAGAPTGACTSGSIDSNTTASAASTGLYFCRGGAWFALTGG